MRIFSWRKGGIRGGGPATADPLDMPLLRFSAVDAWTIRDACAGMHIFGATGSGKTSGSGAAVARAMLKAGMGGLVCCAKPEERARWQDYFATSGRPAEQLVIIKPGGPHRLNFLDYELRRGGEGAGQTENLVNLLTVVMELVEGKPEAQMAGGFWERSGRELLRNTIDLLAIGKGTITLEDIISVVVSGPQTSQQADSAEWQTESFCAQLLATADGASKTPVQAHDLETVARYWLKNFAKLGDRTRSSIVATVTSMADMLLHGAVWEMFGTDTTMVPDAAFKAGAVIVLDMPLQEYHELGRVAQGIWKYMFQRAVLRRSVSQHPIPVFLWADEAHHFVSNFDFRYQAQCRESRACSVYLSQNVSAYYAALGKRGKEETHALLGNFTTQIFHANSDTETNKYASELIGQAWMHTGSYNASRNSYSTGRSESVQYKVLPSDFTWLRRGGPQNNLQVDAVAYRGGAPWAASGETYLPVTFMQGGQFTA